MFRMRSQRDSGKQVVCGSSAHGSAIHPKKWFLGAGFLGAPPLFLRAVRSRAAVPEEPEEARISPAVIFRREYTMNTFVYFHCFADFYASSMYYGGKAPTKAVKQVPGETKSHGVEPACVSLGLTSGDAAPAARKKNIMQC